MATSSTSRLLRLASAFLLAATVGHAQPALNSQNNEAPQISTSGESQFFVSVPELVKSWQALPPSRRTQSRILADIRVDRLRTDYQAVERVQQVIAVVNAADLAAYRTRLISYSPDTQEIAGVTARLYHADGAKSEGEDEGESERADESAADYGTKAREYRFPHLHVGDVIDFEYTLSPKSDKNIYGEYFAELIAFGGALPSNLQRYTLLAPEDIHLASAERGLTPPDVRNEKANIVYSWEKRDIPALVRETLSPSWSEQGAYVHVSNFDSWQALGKWYADLVQPQLTLDAELEKKVAEIVAAHPNRLDRVAAIDELVLDSTQYVSSELGVYRYKPHPVSLTYSRGFGDCKDKASLMVALLRRAGIDADVALVRTQTLGEILPYPASASVFDHAVVYVPEFNLWLDGTADAARLHELPVEDQGVMALTVDVTGNAVLRRTPASSASDNYSRRTIDARLDTDGALHFSGSTYVRGEGAPELRRELKPSDSRVGLVRDRLAEVLPAVEVRDVRPQTLSDAVSMSFEGDLTAFRGHRVAHLPSSWMERKYRAALAASDSRTQELRLDAPWTTEEEVHIQLPPNTKPPVTPDDRIIHSQFGTAELTYRVHDGEIVVLSSVQFSQTRIPVSQYREFRQFTQQLEQAFQRDIEVKFQ